MTREYMESYIKLGREIEKEWERQKRLSLIAKDTVRGSDKEFPYTSRTFTVSGFAQSSMAVKKNRKIIDLEEKRVKVFMNINKFIDSVDDIVMRDILAFKYIMGLSLSDIAIALEKKDKKSYTRDAIKKRLSRFWEKN